MKNFGTKNQTIQEVFKLLVAKYAFFKSAWSLRQLVSQVGYNLNTFQKITFQMADFDLRFPTISGRQKILKNMMAHFYYGRIQILALQVDSKEFYWNALNILYKMMHGYW